MERRGATNVNTARVLIFPSIHPSMRWWPLDGPLAIALRGVCPGQPRSLSRPPTTTGLKNMGRITSPPRFPSLPLEFRPDRDVTPLGLAGRVGV